MTLAPGTRLGPYEIVAPLGAGGMGEVYRAKDTRLGREVAIKVLPAEVASDPERLRRFELEAKAVSALNHPHIVTLHEIGQSDHGPYLVLEKVEGRSLRELLRDGALPVKRVLTLGAQIAEGLAKAHGVGIVHRDLKPENVMVSEDGFAKILDFGLAKLVYPDLEGGAAEVSTLVGRTETGMILGTLGYLSPEQARGEPADFRSDQFALGALLYELASGERPFQRETAAESLAAVIREEPEPIRARNAALPAHLGWIVERCLAKDPNDRYASTRDLARDLATLRDRLGELASGEVAARATRARPLAARLAAGAVIAGLAATLAVLAVRPRAAPDPPSFQPLTFRRGAIDEARFTPDGQTFLYTALWEGRAPEVHLARFDSPESRVVGAAGSLLLAVSATGTVALAVDVRLNVHRMIGTLAEMPLLAGAAPRALAENVVSADYRPGTGELLFGRWSALELFPDRTLVRVRGEVNHPRFAPDGARVAFAAFELFTLAGTPAVVELASGETRELGSAWSRITGLAWAPSGRELWVSGEGSGRPPGLYALDLTGDLRRVWRGPERLRLLDVDRAGRALVARDDERTEAYAWRAGEALEREISWLDQTEIAALSADGSRVLFTDRAGGEEPGVSAYLRELDAALPIRLGAGKALDLSRDGRSALVQRGPYDDPRLALLQTGAGVERPLDAGGLEVIDARLLPDGERLVLSGRRGQDESGSDVDHGHYVKTLDGKAARFLTPAGANYRLALSNDGRWTLGRRRGSDQFFLFPTDPDAGPPRPVRGLAPEHHPVAFAADDRAVYVVNPWRLPPWPVELVDLASGERTLWKRLAPADPTGVLRLLALRIAPDGSAYAYSCVRRLSTLYLAEGLR